MPAPTRIKLFISGNGGETAFLILLTPQEQLTGCNIILTGNQRHGHTGFKVLLNNGYFLLNAAPSALLWTWNINNPDSNDQSKN